MKYQAPWQAEADEVRTLDGRLIAQVFGQYPDYEIRARVIAAAPEVTEALKETLERWVALVNSGDAGFWDPEEELHVIAARAAIAKAEGR